MHTRGSSAAAESSTPSTPPLRPAETKEGISTRLRSRAKGKSTQSEEDSEDPAMPQTPTTAGRTKRATARKPATEDQNATPQTPSRRSTRTAALKANELLHDVADILSPRKRATRATTPAKKTEGASGQQSSGDEVSILSPSRRATRPSATASTSKSTAASRRARKPEAGESDKEDELALQSPTARRRSTRQPASEVSSANETDSAEVPAEDNKKTSVRRHGRASRTLKAANTDENKQENTDLVNTDKTGLPPPHPDLDSVARTLASLAGEASRKKSISSPSSAQSADEEFGTAPESPDKSKKESSADSALAKSVADENQQDSIDEISDLSDVDDPHFTEIMSVEAASVAMSAAESIAGSVSGISDAEDPMPIENSISRASDSDSESDDDAPEVFTSKAVTSATKLHSKEHASKPVKSDGDAVVPDSTAEKPAAVSEKAKKKHRARHRKRIAVVVAKKKASAALDNIAKKHEQPANALPEEIPEEFRLDLDKRLVISMEEKPQAKRAMVGDKLDASVLEEFAQESKKRRIVKETAKERKRTRKEKRSKKKDKASRVVSGIRVVAARPATKMSLLETLAQGVPDEVRKFVKEKHGGCRVKRSDPLVNIARNNNQAAIKFFK
ncbi:hypothetical protein GGI25_000807 [Coemansia spiralis]|uniref:Uncharacterized protein n=2 Tax=Coemansia TaxID=4863 RepID=A0A9W8L0N3_9FUNG|nr:hypothetical protein EDC05_005296 [Coemansia umbellata]KAJ2621071.1 hypothetical protein GGI26_004415 [Coemansia sp. RSA 1358]KAJ2680214.1 hypothetical protein GGI25_000807 [Coemansia spiralis]